MQAFIFCLLSYLTLIHLFSPHRSRHFVNSSSITDNEELLVSSLPGLSNANATSFDGFPGTSNTDAITTSSPFDAHASLQRAHQISGADDPSNASTSSSGLDGRTDNSWSTALSLNFFEQTSAAPRCVTSILILYNSAC